MLQERLSDAAITLHRNSQANNIPYGIFGGFTISCSGGLRESKDVNHIARVNEQQIIQLLNGQNGFVAVPQGALNNVPVRNVQVRGQISGAQDISLLDPVNPFKGKLPAAALRSKFHDSTDLRWLESRFGQVLATSRAQFDLVYIGLALVRYPELRNTFARLGLDTNMKVFRMIVLGLVAGTAANPVPQRKKGEDINCGAYGSGANLVSVRWLNLIVSYVFTDCVLGLRGHWLLRDYICCDIC